MDFNRFIDGVYSLYERFSVKLDPLLTWPIFKEELNEWEWALADLTDELYVRGRIPSSEKVDELRKHAAEELADMVWTATGHTLARGVPREYIIAAMTAVLDKNNAKEPGVTHNFDGTKIRRITKDGK